MSNEVQQFDVIIVGGGMVGAALACLLGDLPVSVALVDRGDFSVPPAPNNTGSPVFDPRVSALTQASRELLKTLGAWDTVASRRFCSYQTMEVWDADGTGSISFSAKEIDQDELGCIVENSAVIAGLYERLAMTANLALLAGERITALESLDSGGHELRTESGTRLQATLLIGADGANSMLRSLAGFQTREWDYHHSALVTTVRTELPHKACARQRFMSTGPLAFLPLSNGAGDDQHYCSIVWSAVPEMIEELMAMDDPAFCKALANAFEQRLGSIESCDKRFAFPLRQRHAVDYVKDGIVLVGDAAHSIHPLAGQGVNLGFLDARALSETLHSGINAGRSLADPVMLRRYQRARIGHNLGMMWVMEGFKYLFAQDALPIRWLRNVGLRSADRMSVVKNHLARRAMGLDWN